VAAREQKQRRMSAQVVEDEDYQLRYEVVAGIDVAKESAVVCVRLPPAAGRKHRTSHLQMVPATVPAITELAAELTALDVQMVSTEATSGYWRVWFAVLEEAGLAVQLVNSSQARNLPGRPKTGKEDARRGRAADRDGDAAVLVRAAAADPGAAGLYPAHLGPDRGPHEVLAAAGGSCWRTRCASCRPWCRGWPGTRPPGRSSRR
jgi:Transposase